MFGPRIQIKAKNAELILLRPSIKEDFLSTQEEHSMLSIRMGENKIFGMSKEDLEGYYEKKRTMEDWVMWSICIGKDEEFIGVASIFKIDRVHSTAEYGYRILKKDQWGKGIISSVHFGTLLYTVNHLNLNTLTAWAYSYNEASYKSLLKHGFYHTATTPHQFFINGSWVASESVLWTNPTRVELMYPDGVPSKYKESFTLAKKSLEKSKKVAEIL